ncbi:hypothetical protein CsSME_00034120 [Camellia sinensis var. sinensis]
MGFWVLISLPHLFHSRVTSEQNLLGRKVWKKSFAEHTNTHPNPTPERERQLRRTLEREREKERERENQENGKVCSSDQRSLGRSQISQFRTNWGSDQGTD